MTQVFEVVVTQVFDVGVTQVFEVGVTQVLQVGEPQVLGDIAVFHKEVAVEVMAQVVLME